MGPSIVASGRKRSETTLGGGRPNPARASCLLRELLPQAATYPSPPSPLPSGPSPFHTPPIWEWGGRMARPSG
jgi:hypothetical protein